jgi:hypothetical protein
LGESLSHHRSAYPEQLAELTLAVQSIARLQLAALDLTVYGYGNFVWKMSSAFQYCWG